MKGLLALSTLIALLSSVSAHSIFQLRFSFCASFSNLSDHAAFATQEVYVNGISQGHTTGIRVPDYDGVRMLVLL